MVGFAPPRMRSPWPILASCENWLLGIDSSPNAPETRQYGIVGSVWLRTWSKRRAGSNNSMRLMRPDPGKAGVRIPRPGGIGRIGLGLAGLPGIGPMPMDDLQSEVVGFLRDPASYPDDTGP